MDWIRQFSCCAFAWPTRCKPVCHAVMSVALLSIACNVSRKQGKCPSCQCQREDDPMSDCRRNNLVMCTLAKGQWIQQVNGSIGYALVDLCLSCVWSEPHVRKNISGNVCHTAPLPEMVYYRWDGFCSSNYNVPFWCLNGAPLVQNFQNQTYCLQVFVKHYNLCVQTSLHSGGLHFTPEISVNNGLRVFGSCNFRKIPNLTWQLSIT